MAKAAATTKRGSPEAIAKRRAARALNTLFDKGPATSGLDGRSARRRQRLAKELSDGKKGQALKAHEVLSHVTELLQMGETLGGIRKLKPRLPPVPALSEGTVATIRATQESYKFDPRAWKVLGLDIDSITGASAPAPEKASRKTAAPKTATAKKKTTRKK